mmetsp:Transcript_36630/g.84460  ORF Transcript_36630/g.84460 Transcript_36630/m.84460 type:complete len:684 (+) Transcript_36630:30-2081(+)
MAGCIEDASPTTLTGKASFVDLLQQLQSLNDERDQELARLRGEVEKYKAAPDSDGKDEDVVPGERKSEESAPLCLSNESARVSFLEEDDEVEGCKSPEENGTPNPDLQHARRSKQAPVVTFCIRQLWMTNNLGRSTAYLEEKKEESIRAVSLNNLYDEETWEDQKVEKPRYRFILSPHGPRRVAWDFLSMILLFYDIVTIPLTAFDPDPTTFVLTMDWVTQIFWTCDIGMSLITGFVQEGKVNMNLYPIFINYLKTWFVLDLMVCGPDWVSTAVEFSSPDEASNPGGVNRLVRALRVVRTVRLLRLVKLKRILAMIKDRITSEAVFILVNICRMILMLLLVNHFIAAAFYLIGSLAEDTANWLDEYTMRKEDASLFFRYSTSLHWSLTQFTPASMDVHPQNVAERCFAIMVLIAGLVLFSSFISSITGSMSQLRNMQADRSKQFWLLRRYLKQQKVPMDLCFRVLRYVEYATSTSHDRVPEGRITILSALTEQLRNELTFFTHYRNLKTHPVFNQIAGANQAILNRMSGHSLSSIELAAGDPLFSLVDAARHMFFLQGGVVRYSLQDTAKRDMAKRRTVTELIAEDVDPNSTAVLTKDDYLCEVVMWSTWSHVGVAKAIAEASVIRVEVTTFCELVQKDPELRELLTLYAHRFVEHLSSSGPEWAEISSQVAKTFTDDFFRAQ